MGKPDHGSVRIIDRKIRVRTKTYSRDRRGRIDCSLRSGPRGVGSQGQSPCRGAMIQFGLHG